MSEIPNLGDLFGGDKSPTEMLEIMFSPENMPLKTQLNMVQIRILCKAKWFALNSHNESLPIAEQKDPIELFEDVVEYFLMLMASFKRQSRKEHIEGLKGLSNLPPESFNNPLLGGK